MQFYYFYLFSLPRPEISVMLNSIFQGFFFFIGIARINLELEAVIHIDDSGEKVGTMLISSTIDGNVQISASRITVLIEIQSLKLVDKEGTLGLPPDALDNLANLSKDIIAQVSKNFRVLSFNIASYFLGYDIKYR